MDFAHLYFKWKTCVRLIYVIIEFGCGWASAVVGRIYRPITFVNNGNLPIENTSVIKKTACCFQVS